MRVAATKCNGVWQVERKCCKSHIGNFLKPCSHPYPVWPRRRARLLPPPSCQRLPNLLSCSGWLPTRVKDRSPSFIVRPAFQRAPATLFVHAAHVQDGGLSVSNRHSVNGFSCRLVRGSAWSRRSRAGTVLPSRLIALDNSRALRRRRPLRLMRSAQELVPRPYRDGGRAVKKFFVY